MGHPCLVGQQPPVGHPRFCLVRLPRVLCSRPSASAISEHRWAESCGPNGPTFLRASEILWNKMVERTFFHVFSHYDSQLGTHDRHSSACRLDIAATLVASKRCNMLSARGNWQAWTQASHGSKEGHLLAAKSAKHWMWAKPCLSLLGLGKGTLPSGSAHQNPEIRALLMCPNMSENGTSMDEMWNLQTDWEWVGSVTVDVKLQHALALLNRQATNHGRRKPESTKCTKLDLTRAWNGIVV